MKNPGSDEYKTAIAAAIRQKQERFEARQAAKAAKPAVAAPQINGQPAVGLDLKAEQALGARVRRMQNELQLARARGEVTVTERAKEQAKFIAVVVRQAILAFPRKHCHRIPSHERKALEIFTAVAHEVCHELQGFAEKVTDPNWWRSQEGMGGEDHRQEPAAPFARRKKKAK